jgi:hypothetical protein
MLIIVVEKEGQNGEWKSITSLDSAFDKNFLSFSFLLLCSRCFRTKFNFPFHFSRNFLSFAL